MTDFAKAPFEFGDADDTYNRDTVLTEHRFYVSLSETQFYGMIIVGIALGYAIMAGVAVWVGTWQPEGWVPYVGMTIGVFTSLVLGSLLMVKSHTWFVSMFALYGMICAPFGVLFGPFVGEVGIGNVLGAAAITACVTILLGLVGLAIPTDLYHSRFADAMILALLAFVVVSILTIYIQSLFPIFAVILAIIGIVLFAMMIIMDFNRAKFVDHNLDTATDISGQVFLDSLNLLLRIAMVLRHFRK